MFLSLADVKRNIGPVSRGGRRCLVLGKEVAKEAALQLLVDPHPAGGLLPSVGRELHQELLQVGKHFLISHRPVMKAVDEVEVRRFA